MYARICMYVVPPLLSGPLGTLDLNPDDRGSGNHDMRPPPRIKTKFNIKIHGEGDIWGYLMNTYSQCEFYSKFFFTSHLYLCFLCLQVIINKRALAKPVKYNFVRHAGNIIS